MELVGVVVIGDCVVLIGVIKGVVVAGATIGTVEGIFVKLPLTDIGVDDGNDDVKFELPNIEGSVSFLDDISTILGLTSKELSFFAFSNKLFLSVFVSCSSALSICV